jgi:DNA polymerase-3 subunit epsilon
MHDNDWRKAPVYMMDFEGSSSSGVVEYGVTSLLGGEIRETWTAVCHPTGTILSRDFGVHGIRQPEADERPPFSSHYSLFVGFRRSGILAAHNRHAENNFIKDTWAVPPVVPDWRAGSGEAQEWGPWIDTLSIYRSLYPRLESHGLGNLVEVFALREELEALAGNHCPNNRRRPHCALYDALASALLLLRLEREANLAGRITVGWLLQLSQETPSQTELF